MSDRLKETHQQIDNAYVNSRDMANTYTDMRIEKLEDKLTNNKKLLKG
jgi:glucan phosphoethanolaminetransferase (alkaline phosphatase superfamily)